MQLRRVLLLFALVLGASALLSSIVAPPESPDEREDGAPAPAAPAGPAGARAPARARFAVPAAARDGRVQTRRVAAGSRLSVEVSVPEPGDVTLEGLGLRASADTLAPARFDLVARPEGRYAVVFVPLRGSARIAGRLIFAGASTVRPRARAD